MMTLGEYSEPRLLIPRLLSSQPEGAIRELANRMASRNRIADADGLIDAVLRRELELPTFIGNGAAIPHVRGAAVRQLSLGVGLSDSGIPWHREKKLTAHVIFIVAVPLADVAEYLVVLSGISSLIDDQIAYGVLRNASRPEHIHRVLTAVRLVRRSSRPAEPSIR